MDQEATVLSKAVSRGAEPFPMLRDRLAHILGVSVRKISRLLAGKWQLQSGRKDGDWPYCPCAPNGRCIPWLADSVGSSVSPLLRPFEVKICGTKPKYCAHEYAPIQ